MSSKNTNKDIMVFGFALFAMFFGAGNLIFPPYLGIVTGPQWFIGFVGFTFADAALALLAVIATAKFDGDVVALFERTGIKLAIALATADILCIGPFLAIPRTGATTYEMGIHPLLGESAPPIIVFVVIFFVLTYILTIKPSKIVDIIGQFLTPALLVALSVIIVVGIVHPIADIAKEPMIDGVFAQGLAYGYQTMDAFAAIALASVLVVSLNEKGYTSVKEKTTLIIKAGVVACIGLSLIYGGLCFLGATVSTKYGIDAEKAKVVVNITESLLGFGGKATLAIAVSLACLTTSIGLTSATGQFFEKLSKGKIKYSHTVLAVCIFSAFMASTGVEKIVAVAGPVLSIVYPPSIVLFMLAFFNEKIKNDNVYKFSVYTSLVVSVFTLLAPSVPQLGFVNTLPLASLGFNWVVPVVIMGIIGHFVPSKSIKAA